MPEKRVALITGASQGIGYEFAKLCAHDGYDLLLVARDKPRLTQIARELSKKHGVGVAILAKDLSEAKAPAEIYAAAHRQGFEVEVLINNAGFGNIGAFIKTPWEKERAMIDVNITALTDLTKIFAKDMVARRSGKILNVASTAAFLPGPHMAVYYATKAYVLSFSYALAHELKDAGVSVTTLCPGPTSSEFQKRAGMQGVELFKRGAMSAERVARVGYRGMQRGKSLVVPGIRNKISVVLTRFVPRALLARIVSRIQTKRM